MRNTQESLSWGRGGGFGETERENRNTLKTINQRGHEYQKESTYKIIKSLNVKQETKTAQNYSNSGPPVTWAHSNCKKEMKDPGRDRHSIHK